MGVSVSASALIFFMSFAICLTMIFGATTAYYEDIREAQSASAQNMEEMIHTAVQVETAGYNPLPWIRPWWTLLWTAS
jgi:archaellum component FlaF (FlaF/FlaG flagellin family)